MRKLLSILILFWDFIFHLDVNKLFINIIKVRIALWYEILDMVSLNWVLSYRIVFTGKLVVIFIIRILRNIDELVAELKIQFSNIAHKNVYKKFAICILWIIYTSRKVPYVWHTWNAVYSICHHTVTRKTTKRVGKRVLDF